MSRARERLDPEDCWMPCVVATIEETLACHHGWEWNPEVGWIHEFGRLW
jgi:hypothetical protein